MAICSSNTLSSRSLSCVSVVLSVVIALFVGWQGGIFFFIYDSQMVCLVAEEEFKSLALSDRGHDEHADESHCSCEDALSQLGQELQKAEALRGGRSSACHCRQKAVVDVSV